MDTRQLHQRVLTYRELSAKGNFHKLEHAATDTISPRCDPVFGARAEPFRELCVLVLWQWFADHVPSTAFGGWYTFPDPTSLGGLPPVSPWPFL